MEMDSFQQVRDGPQYLNFFSKRVDGKEWLQRGSVQTRQEKTKSKQAPQQSAVFNWHGPS